MAPHLVPIHKIRVVAMGTRGEIRQLVKIIEGRHLPGANLVSMLPYASLRLYKNKLIYV